MIPFAKRLESIVSQLEAAASQGDRVQQLRLTVVLLALILDKHKALKQLVSEIERLNGRLNSLPTKLVHKEYYHRSGRGWGNSRGSGYTVGTPGNQLRPVQITKSAEYVDMVQKSVMLQLQYNEELQLLQQYANEFSKHRALCLELKPRNVGQRTVQNVLLRSVERSTWHNDAIEENPVLGCICGRFDKIISMEFITHKLLKSLDDKKGLIGRSSLKQGTETVDKSRNYSRPLLAIERERYNGKRGKIERCCAVENYVKQSELYQSRLGWIVGLKSNIQAVDILQYVDDWKQQYSGTDKLARINAVNSTPYVRTIVVSAIVNVGTIRHLETDIPVYSADCICWESSSQVSQRCYFLGKTGSRIIDEAIRSVDWYHSPLVRYQRDVTLDVRTAIDTFSHRLGFARNQKLSLVERRKELASYARKLVWLETMSMLDSKSAGNCLPGTIQFCETLGIPVSRDWSDTRVDTRKLLRAWKANSYGVNRLLLPAIDSAVKRVKSEISAMLLPLTAVYVPSVVQ